MIVICIHYFLVFISLPYSFVHAGHFPRMMKRPLRKDSNWYQPVGETDSENFFCLLLSELAARYPEGDPGYVKLFEHIREVWIDLCSDGNGEECDPVFVNEGKGGSIGNIIMYVHCLFHQH